MTDMNMTSNRIFKGAEPSISLVKGISTGA